MVAQLETRSATPSSQLTDVEGLIQVFTGSNRRFFTEVISQALRRAGLGTSVLVVQFLKGGINQGIAHPIRLGQNLDWFRCDLPRCIDSPEVTETELRSIQELWHYTQKLIIDGDYALVVLDELSLAINFGLIPETEVLRLFDQKPTSLDLILTGPNMSDSILDRADQVTHIRRTYCP